jgi:hypothetical protein
MIVVLCTHGTLKTRTSVLFQPNELNVVVYEQSYYPELYLEIFKYQYMFHLWNKFDFPEQTSDLLKCCVP